MPITTELCENGQVIHFKMIDPWTVEDLFKGFAQSNAFRDKIQQEDPNRRVHTLLDLIMTRQAPPGVLQGRKLPALTHAIRGEIIVAADHEYPRSMISTILKLGHADAHFFDTVDAAWDYLHKIIVKTDHESA